MQGATWRCRKHRSHGRKRLRCVAGKCHYSALRHWRTLTPLPAVETDAKQHFFGSNKQANKQRNGGGGVGDGVGDDGGSGGVCVCARVCVFVCVCVNCIC